MKIKAWKVGQIMSDMSRYGDAYTVECKGHEFGTYYKDCADENGYIEVLNVYEVIKESEKAMQLNIGGFKCWVPKSAIAE